MNFTNKVRSWSTTLQVEQDDEKKFWGRKPTKPRKMGDPLPPPKGKLPKKNSDKKVLEGYYLLKRLGKPVDAIEPLILHLL
jgi:hypothetical protein